tara:strand:+ start:74387 stop:74881 length:495 start_codon:yes stop_codon:yes gene_type:complete
MSNGAQKRTCEWNDCNKEGRYRIQTSADRDDIHYFCQLHARTFDLGVVNQGPFFGSAGPNWTQKNASSKGSTFNGYEKSAPGVDKDVRIRHVGSDKTLNYTKEDLENLKTLGLDTGSTPEEIKKAYKLLVKHCHPDQNPDLENGIYIFNQINEAYNALKDKDFS